MREERVETPATSHGPGPSHASSADLTLTWRQAELLQDVSADVAPPPPEQRLENVRLEDVLHGVPLDQELGEEPEQ